MFYCGQNPDEISGLPMAVIQKISIKFSREKGDYAGEGGISTHRYQVKIFAGALGHCLFFSVNIGNSFLDESLNHAVHCDSTGLGLRHAENGCSLFAQLHFVFKITGRYLF